MITSYRPETMKLKKPLCPLCPLCPLLQKVISWQPIMTAAPTPKDYENVGRIGIILMCRIVELL
jgi:hypothetical protein